MIRKRLGEMLVDARLLSEQQLRVALKEQQRWGGSLGRTVVEMKLVGEPDLVRVLAEQLKVAAIDLDAIEIPQSVLAWVTADMADLHALVPYAQPMKFLDIAMADPTNTTVLDELRTRTKLNIRPALAGPKMIERAIGKYYGRGFSRFYGDIPLALDNEGPALEVEKSDNEPMLDDLLVEDGDPGVKMRRPAVVAKAAPQMPPPSPPPHASPTAGSAPPAPPAASMRPPVPRAAVGSETAGLERRIADLEARVAKQDAIITKLVSALAEHGLGDRADLLR
jgi:type IV pilus assembly protein PilB